jgi:DNA-binding GntR family transcriptional regulator
MTALSLLMSPYLPVNQKRGQTTDAVTAALREAILDGVLPPSTWLREDEVSQAFGISRTPAREALRRLADEGLANKTANQGTVVALLSLEDILALYVVREDLEGLAARLAAFRRPPKIVTELANCQAGMASATDDPSRLMQLNLTFHRLIRQAAGNSYLDRFLTQLEHAVRRLPVTTFAHPGRPERALEEHAAIIDSIRKGDGAAAEAAARAHMRQAREIRLSMLLGS